MKIISGLSIVYFSHSMPSVSICEIDAKALLEPFQPDCRRMQQWSASFVFSYFFFPPNFSTSVFWWMLPRKSHSIYRNGCFVQQLPPPFQIDGVCKWWPIYVIVRINRHWQRTGKSGNFCEENQHQNKPEWGKGVYDTLFPWSTYDGCCADVFYCLWTIMTVEWYSSLSLMLFVMCVLKPGH